MVGCYFCRRSTADGIVMSLTLLSNIKAHGKSYGLPAATQDSLWTNYVGDVAVIVVEQAWYMYG